MPGSYHHHPRKKTMSDEEWCKLFDLIAKVVNEENKTANEKAAELNRRVLAYGAKTDCDEFAAMLIND
jgi:hypothetical protein